MTIFTAILADAANSIPGIRQINLLHPYVVTPNAGVTKKTTLMPIAATVPMTNGTFSADLPESKSAQQADLFKVLTTTTQHIYYLDDGSFYCSDTDLPWHLYTDGHYYTGTLHLSTSNHLNKVTTTTQTQVRDSVSAVVPSSLTSVNFADLERTGFYSESTPQTAQQVANVLKRDSTFIQNITIPKGKYNPTATYPKENVLSANSKYSVLHINSATNLAPSASTPTWAHLDSTLNLASTSLIKVAASGDLPATPNPVLTPNASLNASTQTSPTSLTVVQKGRVLSETSSSQSPDVSVLPSVDLALSKGQANLGSCGVMNTGVIKNGDPSSSFSVQYPHVRESKISLSFGDSITVGYGVDPSLRWSKLVANALGAVEDDEGMSGTLLQDASNTPYGNAGYSRYQSAIINRDPDYLFILYGINDLRFNDASVTVFQTELTKIVQDSIASGIKPGNITIGNPPYIDSAAYTSSAPFNAGSLAKQEQYSEATHAVAHQLGTKWADVFGAMQSHGKDSLVFDSLHPDAAGHQVIANALLSATFV